MVWVRSPVYFYNRNGTYYFSRAVPSDLRHRFPKRKIEVSLRTKSESKAARSAATIAELRRIALQNYDPEALMSEVIASQRRRRFIATIPGTTPSWDYVAYQGDADRYVRRDGVDATKSRLRLPRAESVMPDMPDLPAKTIDKMMRGELNFSP